MKSQKTENQSNTGSSQPNTLVMPVSIKPNQKPKLSLLNSNQAETKSPNP